MMGAKFSVCEIVELGTQIEKNGYDFYKTLEETVKDKAASKVFKCLAEEEQGHIETFKKLFRKTCEYNPEGAYPDEYFSFMRVFASQYVFTRSGRGKELALKVNDMEAGINMGIQAEKDSIIFYEEMRKYVRKDDRDVINELIQEEKSHLVKLCGLKGGNQGKECKCV